MSGVVLQTLKLTTMEYRKIGTSDLELSVITFGAWAAGGWMWGGSERKDAVKGILAAFDQGVTSIDTAPIYGMGESEEIVGEAIKQLPRDQVQILTKYGLRWDLAKGDFYFSSKDNNGKSVDIYKHASKESVRKECEDSLKRLGTDYIDLYQIHWPDASTPIQETMETVADLQKEGKIRYAGVCNYNLDQFKEALNYIDLVSDQVKYNMINRKIEDDLVPYLIEKQKSVIAYSPMERGLLTGKIKPGHEFAEGDHRAGNPVFEDDNIKRVQGFLEKIEPIAKEKNATLAQLSVKWAVSQPGITVALVGARNAEQSVQNAKAVDIQLSGDDIKFINDELEKLELNL